MCHYFFEPGMLFIYNLCFNLSKIGRNGENANHKTSDRAAEGKTKSRSLSESASAGAVAPQRSPNTEGNAISPG